MESIKWREHDAGGFIGVLHGVTIHVTGSEFTVARMTICADHESYIIYEPFPIQTAPLGKAIEAFKVHILGKEPTPVEPEIQAIIHLKKTLAEVVRYAAGQCLSRYQDPQYERKLRERIWSKMSGGFEP